ncbi:MAG: hypothetical protein ACXADW_16365 [Candidatus Hodarchaeales archaeon]|jgi:hypothetical protein
MSESYVGKQTETTFSIYNKRLIYKRDSINSDYKNLTDFNIGEKILYGKVTRNFQPIFISNQSPMLKFVGDSQHRSIHFVSDMFNRLKTQFDKNIADGKLSGDDPFLSSLKVYKAYQDPVGLHSSYLNTYFGSLSNQLKNNRYDSIERFMTVVEGLLSESLKLYPITFAAFVKSRICPISVSGLVIEIADADYYNDEQKINKFINSPNWLFYLNACRSYGFMIDKLYPWRLIADIGSTECLKYSRNYSLLTTDQILLNYYRTDLIFFNKLKYYLINLYNNNINTYAEDYDCNGSRKTRYVKRSKIDINIFDNIISQQRLLRLYMMIRIMEEDKHLTETEKVRLMNDTLGIYRIKGLSAALNKFEKIINQPFDSSGSLSYLYDGYLRRQEEP